MSTLTGRQNSTALHSEADLADYFQRFAKPRTDIRVGIEAEFFPVRLPTGEALSYDGPDGIEAILRAMAGRFGYEPVLEEGHVIALKRKNLFITLEPGGQMELSAPPVKNIFEIQHQISIFLGELRQIQEEFPCAAWLAFGIHPFSPLEKTAWVPKKRYAIMAEHFKTHGELSHQMMRITATNQINFDYLSEENAMAGLRTALGITSIISALFANSCFEEGRPNGFQTRRMQIWNQMDPDRSGIIPFFMHPGRRFSDYLEYLLEMPVMFIVRGSQWVPVKGLNFRRFIRSGYQNIKATLGDFELHLSTAFPEARLKQYLEVRGADCQCPALIPALAALWKGILYDSDTRDRAWDLVAFASDAERLALHAAIPKQGLKALLGSKPILPIARELVRLAETSLKRQGLAAQLDESGFLCRLRERLAAPGLSPADIFLAKWEGEFGRDPRKALEAIRIA